MCIVHFAIAILDFLNIHAEKLNLIKQIIKKLRTPEYRRLLNLNKLPIPQIDNQTRWSSKYLLFIYLFKLRNFIEFQKDIDL